MGVRRFLADLSLEIIGGTLLAMTGALLLDLGRRGAWVRLGIGVSLVLAVALGYVLTSLRRTPEGLTQRGVLTALAVFLSIVFLYMAGGAVGG